MYQEVSGDFEFVARVLNAPLTTWGFSSNGIQLRRTLDANSPVASLTVLQRKDGERRFGCTDMFNDWAGAGEGAPIWFKLRRQGTLITAFRSDDGASWTQVGGNPCNIDFQGGPALIGLRTVAGRDEIATGQYDNVTPHAAVAHGFPSGSGSLTTAGWS